MGDSPRRRQFRSCDQCRAGKRRCDLGLNTRPGSSRALSDSLSRTTHSPCTNCVKWKKECTVDWVRSQEKQRALARSRNAKGKRMKSKSDAVTERSGLKCFDDIAPVFNLDNPLSTTASSDVDPFDCLFDSNLIDCPQQQEPVETGKPATFPWTFEPICQDLPEANSATFSSLLVEPAVDATDDCTVEATVDATSETLQSHCSECDLRKFDLLVVAQQTPTSIMSSHSLAADQYRIGVRHGLLRIYYDCIESEMSNWFVEKNCPFEFRPFLDTKIGWGSNRFLRLVTRVCNLDESFPRTNPLSNYDRQQASKSLTLAMMTMAAQWAHLLNEDGDPTVSRHPQTSGPRSFERSMQRSLWQQTNLALGEALANPSFKVIYASIIFSLTQRPSDTDDEFMPHPCQTELASLHKILDRDTSPTYLDFAVRKLHQHERGERIRRAGHTTSSEKIRQLSPDDQWTYAMVFWLAIMFDSVSAAINCTSFGLEDTDTNIIYRELNRDRSRLISNATPSVSDCVSASDNHDKFITELLSLDKFQQPYQDLNIWGDYFLSEQTRSGIVRKQKTRWPCSDLDAASCLADGATVLILFFRRIGQLQNLYSQRAPAEEITLATEAALEVYHHWSDTYGLFLEDCLTHHRDLSSRIQSWYVLQLSNFSLGIIILSDLMDKVDEAYVTEAEAATMHVPMPTQTSHCSTSLRFRAAYMISDLARCCCNENADIKFSESLGIHSAVDEAALLREPWPTVLTRSFTYTSEIFVKLVQAYKDSDTSADPASLQDAQRRLDDCIEALWLLGRKSDMALCASKVLRQIAHPVQMDVNSLPV